MQVKNRNLLTRFLIWRARHISQEQFVLILSVLVGFVTGLVAVLLKSSTHFIQQLVSSGYLTNLYNPYYFVFPVIGILITVLIKFLIKGKVGEGIPSALYAISRKGGYLAPNKIYASIVTSIFTVGFGGSVGLEGPTISTGSAIGSNLGRLMHINYKSRVLLMGCASAGAMASIFNAPIAAIIFTIEIFSLDLTLKSLIPLLLSSAAGVLTSLLMQGNDYMLQYSHEIPLQLGDIPFYVLLGIGCAYASIYFNKVYLYVEQKFEKISDALNAAGGNQKCKSQFNNAVDSTLTKVDAVAAVITPLGGGGGSTSFTKSQNHLRESLNKEGCSDLFMNINQQINSQQSILCTVNNKKSTMDFVKYRLYTIPFVMLFVIYLLQLK